MIAVIYDNNELIKKVFNSNYIYKGIVIDGTNVSLYDDYIFLDNSKIKSVNLKRFTILHGESRIHLFIYKEEYLKYSLYENNGLCFGKNEENDIVSIDDFVNEDYFILKDNIIETNSSFLFVNSKKYNGENLIDGDVISLFGFEIIYFNKFLYINDFKVNNKLKKYNVLTKPFKYGIIKPTYNNFYIDTNNTLIFDKLKEPNLPKKTRQKNFILQIAPSFSMSLAMGAIAYINIEKNALYNDIYSILPVIIMPSTMIISSILWPLIAFFVEKRSFNKEYKKEKNNYLNYLCNYEKRCDDLINKYLKKEYDSFFCKNNILKKLFYIQKNSKAFETITLGFYTKVNDYNQTECEDEDINKYLLNINKKMNHIDNHPLCLDIKKYKVITVYSKSIKYLLKRYLLELSSKYHYNDINIVIFDKSRELFKGLYNIPHLFNESIRLTFSEERDLNILNSIDKEVIILCVDKFETVLNDNCHVIYFTDHYDLFKNNECVVEYENKYGVLNDLSSTKFNWVMENIDFDKCFEQISYYFTPCLKINTYSFNSFYNVLDIEKNYLARQLSLAAYFSVSNGNLLSFDLHENKDGPHGLIGGSTGSGKSELIVSLILSLCIKYRPDYLNIILIDYKGGGIADSLSYNGNRIPHIIGEISNLSEGDIDRLIYALSFECKRREECFKKMSNLINSSITNIDDYIDNYDDGLKLPKIAHLLIIVDEFAELKKNSPDVIKQLISFSRIGRSLGLHLILSTQKPNGVIDDEIWSNSHFKIALKMHDEKDSKDIIKIKDAAYIKNPGDFILQVDNNISKRESLYSKKDYLDYKRINVSLLDDQYNISHTKTIKKESSISEAMYYTSYIIDVVKKLNINVQSIDFKKPKEIKRELINKNGFTLGIVDDYLNAVKYPYSVNFNENIFICSTRDSEINNILNILNENKIESIIISNRYFENTYTANSILYDEKDKINFLFNVCNLNKFKGYIVIEDFSNFISYDDNYVQYVYKLLSKTSSASFHFIILSKQVISNFKILNCFSNKIVIEIADQNDLVSIYGRKSKYINSSYVNINEPVSFVPCVIEEFNKGDSIVSSYINDIPEHIEFKQMDNSICIGFNNYKRQYVYIDKVVKTLIITLSHDVKSLDRLFNGYRNVDVLNYSASININDYQCIIWLGPGIFKQRLFMADIKNDLRVFEAYLMNNKEREVFRFCEF